MKLVDFYEFVPFNSLRSRMGIPSHVYGSLTAEVSAGRLTALELDRLVSPDGLDIESLDDLIVLDDGTLAYKDSRVILYIRDVKVYGNRPVEPRFHLANCQTLLDMRSKNRLERYVVSTRLDGRFKINLLKQTGAYSDVVALHVCQNCLNFLRFDGFSMDQPKATRLDHVQRFTIDGFFRKFPQSLHIHSAKHTDEDSPLNDYSVGFRDISLRVRKAAGWCCQACGLDLSDGPHRQFLHTHHTNGVKSDNSERNLRVLCLGCHADEPSHSHMKVHRHYLEFLSIRKTVRSRRR